MTGIELKDNCLEGSSGQRNMTCISWNVEKERVINVVCVLKCEASKVAAAGKASNNLEGIKVSRDYLQTNQFEDN